MVAYVPVAPIISKRISYTRNSDYATYDASGYFVYETLPLDRKQVVSVYVWFAAIIAPFVVLLTFPEALAKLFGDEDRAGALFLLFTAIAFVSPYFLRRWAKRRKMQEWKRQSLGLHG